MPLCLILICIGWEMKFVMLSYHLSTNQNEALTITTPKTEKLNISNLFCFGTTLTIVQHFTFYGEGGKPPPPRLKIKEEILSLCGVATAPAGKCTITYVSCNGFMCVNCLPFTSNVIDNCLCFYCSLIIYAASISCSYKLSDFWMRGPIWTIFMLHDLNSDTTSQSKSTALYAMDPTYTA